LSVDFSTTLEATFTGAFEGAFAGAFTTVLATVLAGVFTTALTAPFGALLGALFDADFTTGLLADLVATLATGLALALTAGFTTLAVPALAGVALTLAGLLGFFTADACLASLALGLDDLLFLFDGIFELVLRGFFTSCLLTVAACEPCRGHQPIANDAGSKNHLHQNPNVRPSGCVRAPNKAALQAADCSDRSRHKRNLSN
jgi:hypothetical protein